MTKSSRAHAHLSRIYRIVLQRIHSLNFSALQQRRQALLGETQRSSNALYRRSSFAESLEPRLLLASDFSFDASGETESVDLRLTTDGAQIQLYNQQDGTLLTSQAVNTSSGTVTITGSDFADALTIDESMADFTISFVGGAGLDTLLGPNLNNDWQIKATNQGTVNSDINFESIENLTGGTRSDVFTFADGTSVAGVLAGGGGEDAIDYSDYETAITIDLENQTTTGAAQFTDVEEFVGGKVSDSLAGFADDSFWRLSEEDGGQIEYYSDDIQNVVVFSSVENLSGADNSSDTFFIEVDGGVSGTIDGGAGDFDRLVVAREENDDTSLINVQSASAAVSTIHGKSISYTEIEPLITGTVNAPVISGSGFSDGYLLRSDDATTLELRTLGGD
ncbi:MAG: hypothetical protein CMM07_14690, partial [Rhodopirellula sp.]|nr:hypothetical protein [Rhodopirellula sp.]